MMQRLKPKERKEKNEQKTSLLRIRKSCEQQQQQ